MGGIIRAGNVNNWLSSSLIPDKRLLPIYDRLVVYYLLIALIFAGIQKIFSILNDKLLNDRSQWGLLLDCMGQPNSGGLPQVCSLVDPKHYVVFDFNAKGKVIIQEGKKEAHKQLLCFCSE